MTRPNEREPGELILGFALSILAAMILLGFVGWMVWFAWRTL